MNRYRYKWTKSYAVPAEVVGPIVQRCGSAESVVDEAESTDSPIHSLFQWDDTRAGREFRLIQARTMIASLLVEVITPKKKTLHVTAFVSKTDRSGFVPTMEANDAELNLAERRCLQEMKRFRVKWNHLKLARPVIAEIDQVSLTVARKSGRRRAAA